MRQRYLCSQKLQQDTTKDKEFPLRPPLLNSPTLVTSCL